MSEGPESKGYTPQELDQIQDRWELNFPPDLIELMLVRRPLMPDGLDWLEYSPEAIEEILNWPFEGFLFDVKEDDLWWDSWGPKPKSFAAQKRRLREVFDEAPKLIPLFGHRYLPETPREAGNPVFSVYQSDVIFYGVDLADWIICEEQGWFVGRIGPTPIEDVKTIPFWTEAVVRNGEE